MKFFNLFSNNNDTIDDSCEFDLSSHRSYWLQNVEAVSTDPIEEVEHDSLVIDGVIINDGDRVLLTRQKDSSENGVYKYVNSELVKSEEIIHKGTCIFVNNTKSIYVSKSQTNFVIDLRGLDI